MTVTDKAIIGDASVFEAEPGFSAAPSVEAFTPAPWHTCQNGECSCAIISCANYPIAKVTVGEWGDQYPTLEPEGGSIEGVFKAVNRMIVYGAVNRDTATANMRLIGKAPEMYALLRRALSEPRERWRAEAERVLIEAVSGDQNYKRAKLPDALLRQTAPPTEPVNPGTAPNTDPHPDTADTGMAPPQGDRT